jgi:hypothetical protein
MQRPDDVPHRVRHQSVSQSHRAVRRVRRAAHVQVRREAVVASPALLGARPGHTSRTTADHGPQPDAGLDRELDVLRLRRRRGPPRDHRRALGERHASERAPRQAQRLALRAHDARVALRRRSRSRGSRLRRSRYARHRHSHRAEGHGLRDARQLSRWLHVRRGSLSRAARRRADRRRVYESVGMRQQGVRVTWWGGLLHPALLGGSRWLSQRHGLLPS